MKLRARVDELNRAIDMGQKLEALHEFYADRVRVQENLSRASYGLPAYREQERRFFSTLREWRGFTVKAVAVEGNLSYVDGVARYVTADGRTVSRDQVAVARWKGDKIVQEEVYFDSVAGESVGQEVCA
jgi:ketosteroid isomerase-like protein